MEIKIGGIAEVSVHRPVPLVSADAVDPLGLVTALQVQASELRAAADRLRQLIVEDWEILGDDPEDVRAHKAFPDWKAADAELLDCDADGREAKWLDETGQQAFSWYVGQDR